MCLESEGNAAEEKNPDAAVVTIEDPDESTPKKPKKKRERPPPDPTDPAVIAAKAAAHSKIAEEEAKKKLDAEAASQPSRLDECKYYTSLILGKNDSIFKVISIQLYFHYRYALYRQRFRFLVYGAVCLRPCHFDPDA